MAGLSLIRKKEALEAWDKCQLSDGQLNDLTVMYTDMIETLEALGERGSLMHGAVRLRLYAVTDMINNRARDRR